MHPSDGMLRRWLDEPFAAEPGHRAHLATCPRCRERAQAARSDRERAVAVLSVREAPDAGAALARLRDRLPADAGERPRPQRVSWLADPRRRSRLARRSAVIALAVSASAVLLGAGIAQGFITIFQPNQLVPVAVSPADIDTLAQLARYGDISGLPSLDITAATRTQAQAASGVVPPDPTGLPPGMPTVPSYALIGGGTVSFTFDRAKAEATAHTEGATLPPMPANIDGSTLQLTLPTALVESYGVDLTQLLHGGGGSVGQGLVVVASRLPTVRSTGVTATQIEDYLLAQPSVPADLAAEIRAIADPTHTLPVPIPVSAATAQPVSLHGVSGLLIGDQTGAGSLVLWQRDGVVFAVLGTLSPAEVLGVARSIG